MLLIPGHGAERPAAPEQQDHPRDSAAFQAISGFSLLPMERELGRLLRKEGAGRGSWCGQGSTRSVPEKVGLLCKRELVLRNPFHELSSPDLLLQQEQSHTKAFSPKQK